MTGFCYLTGRYGIVERHHIFGGALRDKSERYGLTVYLSPEAHRTEKFAAHQCRETANRLKAEAQKKVMLQEGWNLETFIREFNRNYLEAVEVDEVYRLQEMGRGIDGETGGFEVCEGEMPF